jgi:hypothetical protein
MIRPTILALSLMLSVLFVVGPAYAGEPLYRASLEKPAATRTIVKDIAWSCTGADCVAPRTASAPDGNVCTAVARKLGRLVSFQSGDRAFAAAELEKCNMAAN